LVEHQHFDSKTKAIEEDKDIISDRIFIEANAKRKRVSDTDVGKQIKIQIEDLQMLLAAFRKGLIKETN
jgi:fructose-1,6-bisphosphatase-3